MYFLKLIGVGVVGVCVLTRVLNSHVKDTFRFLYVAFNHIRKCGLKRECRGKMVALLASDLVLYALPGATPE